MLSKLRYSGSEIRLSSIPGQEVLTRGIQDFLGSDLTKLTPVTGGTLGVCFKGNLNGQPRFFKTHAISSGRLTLRREAVFLRATASEQIDPHLLYVPENGSKRTWLHTRLLGPCGPLSPSEVLALVGGYEASLRRHPELAREVPASDSIHLLLSEAESALDFMAGTNLLSPLVSEAARSGIERLKVICDALSLQLCHGDLGPANIMIDGNSCVVLDWEDVFWGIAGYDYLYWLTFFDNRKWLTKDVLGHTPLGFTTEILLMVTILLLKSWISVRSGSYHRNTISINQRLLEVINLE